MPAVKKIGMVVKRDLGRKSNLPLKIARWLMDEKKVSVSVPDTSSATIKKIKGVKILPESKVPERCELLIVLGGDGTFLAASRLMQKKSIPIFAVNMGNLGFLTEIKKDEVYGLLELALKGKYKIYRREMLEVAVKKKGKTVLKQTVLNDAVLSKSNLARIMELEVSINDELVSVQRGDGLIVATPTGSTAYSLAAGGPIVHPGHPSIILTPISPHTLSNRPMVLSPKSHLQLKITSAFRKKDVMLTLDGQTGHYLETDEEIHITMFKNHPIKIVANPYRSYFDVLRTKLKFGKRI